MFTNGFLKMKDINILESFEEIDISCDKISSFDRTVGLIEDILVDEGFLGVQKSFLDKYCHEFDDDEENKLIYMDIFQHYVNIVEQTIETKLKEALPNFDMNAFYNELRENRDQLDGEVFEMLFTLSEFSAFKEMMLDYKAEKEGKSVDFSKDLCITPISFCDDHDDM